MKGNVAWLWQATRGIRWSLCVSLVTGVIRVISGLGFIYVCKRLVDIATGHASGDLMQYTYLLIGILVLELVCSVCSSRCVEFAEIRQTNLLRYRLFDHRLRSLRESTKTYIHTGDVLNRLGEDVRVVVNSLCRSLPALCLSLLQLIAAFFFLHALNATLAYTLIAFLPICLLLSKWFFTKVRRQTAEIRESYSKAQSLMQESLRNRTVIQTLEKVPYTNRRLSGLHQMLIKQVMRRTNFTLFSRTMVMIGFQTGYLIAFLWGIHGLQDDLITFGVMTAYLQLVGQIQRPLVDLSSQVSAMVHTFTSTHRLRDLEKTPPEEVDILDEPRVG